MDEHNRPISNNKDSEKSKIGLLAVWAVGVGSALGGDFFGWQFTLYGGFVPALCSVGFSALFYWLYAGAITELACRYQSTGGGFDFVLSVLGRKYATVMAVLSLLKLILANAATALAISSYMGQGGLPYQYKVVCWIVTYGVFTLLDCLGIRHSANGQIAATFLCVFVLMFSSISNFTVFNWSNLTTKKRITGGFVGLLKGLPYALQFFDGFEDIPLLISYTMNPEDTIPKAISLCYVTVTVISMFVLVSGVGAVSIIDLLHSEAPLMDGIELVYGEGSSVSDAVAYVIVLGLIVNFFSFILFASQQIQSIADAGFLPAFLAYRHPVYSSPIYASIVSSSTGLLFCVCFSFILSEDMAQNVLLMAALMAAILSYMLVLECIVRIRNVEHRIKDIEDDSSEFPKQVLAVTDAELHSLGNDPHELRFFYNAFGARWGQLMCVMLAAGLLTLCSTSYDYMYGLIVLVLLGSIMLWTISRISSRRHRLDLDDSAAAHSTTRDNSDSLKRLLNNWGGNFAHNEDEEDEEEVEEYNQYSWNYAHGIVRQSHPIVVPATSVSSYQDGVVS